MTSQRDNEILTRTGPGTPLGELMRQYWIPVAKSSELVADGDPVRLMVLGEKLIAFRDTSGRVGIMDHRCPHRCASFFFGRNEENGIRCVYHGWKFDVDGNCTDMANVPPHQDFKHKVKAKAYKAAERNGIVWAFMGHAENAGRLPDLEATLVPEEDMDVVFLLGETNWLQSAEADLDTSHLGVLHLGMIDASYYREDDLGKYVVADRQPEYVGTDTDFGYMYAAHRPADDGNTYWRVGNFLFPFWTQPPICPIETNILARAYVPIDDEHCMLVYWTHKRAEFPGSKGLRKPIVGGGPWRHLPNATDWLGRWRLMDNGANDFSIDRELQRTKSYSGITGINLQDLAVVWSMGAIEDRTFEHLAPSDFMITNTRRQIVRAALAYERDGTLPKSAHDHTVYRNVRSGAFLAKNGADWLGAHRDKIATVPLKAPQPMAAE